MKQKKIGKRYCRKVKAMLLCDRRSRRDILERISSGVANFLESHPNADYPMLVRHFGQPEEIAAVYYQELDTAAILRAVRIRRRIVRWVAGGVIAAMLAFVLFLSATVIDLHRSYYGTIEAGEAVEIP